MSLKILAFAGSVRRDSWNKKLISYVATLLRKKGVKVTLIDLKDFPMPVYDGDLESENGSPKSVKDLKRLMCDHDAFIISSPEYNSEIPPLLKNTIDWVSRPDPEDKKRLIAFSGKTAAVLSAAPGAQGGTRVRMSLRALLAYMGVVVVPEQYGLNDCGRAFAEDGSILESIDQTLLHETLNRLIALTPK